MKRVLSLCLMLFVAPAYADEGMWTPAQLPDLANVLESRGLQIDPRSMTDLTGHPMKAIVSLGGCSASFVSPQGLVITNLAVKFFVFALTAVPLALLALWVTRKV